MKKRPSARLPWGLLLVPQQLRLRPMVPALLLFLAAVSAPAATRSGLDHLLREISQPQTVEIQRDILKGLNAGLAGQRQVTAPSSWEEAYEKLSQTGDGEIRRELQKLAVTFGDKRILPQLRAVLKEEAADLGHRTNALVSLVVARDPELPGLLHQLLDSNALRMEALKSLSAFEASATPVLILQRYAGFNPAEKQQALYTLSARPAFARAMIRAVGEGKIARSDLTAAQIRQLSSLRLPEVNQWIEQEWGTVRPTAEAKQKEIARLKTLLSEATLEKGDLVKGRALYLKVCGACHRLFGEGGEVGPDLTGGNRSDLDYLLLNIVAPSAAVSRDHQAWLMELTDGRVMNGLKLGDEQAVVTFRTEKELLKVPRRDIKELSRGELSMMPEGLLESLKNEEIRDLIAWLRSQGPVP